MFIRFKELRENRKMTKEQLAEEMGLHINIINAVENGYNAPVYVLVKYAKYFNVSCDYILELSDENYSNSTECK